MEVCREGRLEQYHGVVRRTGREEEGSRGDQEKQREREKEVKNRPRKKKQAKYKNK